ncbi:MAG: hypothetical protein ACI8Y4_000708 [Candidatus Poriferisodalaceae bacterium]|jgi:hypothetical protein
MVIVAADTWFVLPTTMPDEWELMPRFGLVESAAAGQA